MDENKLARKLGFVPIGELEDLELRNVISQLKDFIVGEKPMKQYEIDNLTFLVQEEEPFPERPLWVQQQENKKLWRK